MAPPGAPGRIVGLVAGRGDTLPGTRSRRGSRAAASTGVRFRPVSRPQSAGSRVALSRASTTASNRAAYWPPSALVQLQQQQLRANECVGVAAGGGWWRPGAARGGLSASPSYSPGCPGLSSRTAINLRPD